MAGAVAFIVLGESYIASHCVPMLRAANELNLAATVIGPVGAHRDLLEAEEAREIPLNAGRSGFSPIRAGHAAGQIAAELKSVKPDLVHCVGLRSVLIGGAAAAMAGIGRRVYGLPGLGYRATKAGLLGAGTRASLRVLLTEQLRSAGTRFVFEAEEDAGLLHLDPSDARLVTTVGGPGIAPEMLRPSAPPPSPPLRVATLARASWADGTEVVIEAVRLARAQGAEIELSIYAGPEPSSRQLSDKKLRAWSNESGVVWQGPVEDAALLWGAHHVACLPSRGGDGLPRMLVEAASCGRPVVTTDVPGPGRLVRDGLEGFLVPPEDAPALAAALAKFAADPVLVPRMGAAARARVLHGFTERDVTDELKRLYADMLGGPARP